MNCHATTGLPKIGPSRPFAALQMVPPDQLWHCGWSPFATAGPPYNPAFIAFLLNHSYVKNCAAFLVELKNNSAACMSVYISIILIT